MSVSREQNAFKRFVWLSEQPATVFLIIKPTACIYKACKIYMTISLFLPFDFQHKGITSKLCVVKILKKPFFT